MKVKDSTAEFLAVIYKPREFDQKYNKAISWSTRKNESLSFLMFDIDHFK